MRTQKIVTLPLRLGVSVARVSLKLTASALNVVISHRPGAADGPPPPEARPPRPRSGADEREPARRQAPAASRGSENGAVVDPRSAATEPPPPAPSPPPGPSPEVTPTPSPDELPDTPLTRAAEAAEVAQEPDEVVAEFAEPGAEDGAGAQIDVEAPWEGYDDMAAQAVVARIAQSEPAELAVLQLYEGTHKGRRTVLAAAERRLRDQSPPGGG